MRFREGPAETDTEVLVNSGVSTALELVQGPVFRFAFALMVLGFLRLALIQVSEAAAARLVGSDRSLFRAKLMLRVRWWLAPHLVLRPVWAGGAGWSLYHLGLSFFSLVFRVGAIVVPAFMTAHVHLWKRGLGISWPALPAGVGDTISILTIAAGFTFFFGRLYSPLLRKTEPTWSFLTPLILIAPFVTGVLAMHPTWSPIRYQVMLLLHVLSACLVFVLLPFARLLSFMHCPIARWVPQAAWREVPPVQRGVETRVTRESEMVSAS
jgi:hypothetical protein